ncbi:hypothetical protein GTW98_14645 [Streptomyces sp. SID8375]|nr:hypothetical protein [Streptomyces sp. SID8375]
MNATHQGSMEHATLLGHSYGSLVSGKALTVDDVPPVDQAVFVGCPGVGVDHTSELGLDPSHVWAGTAANDSSTRRRCTATTRWKATSAATRSTWTTARSPAPTVRSPHIPSTGKVPHCSTWDDS